jgi:hypothetical protein
MDLLTSPCKASVDAKEDQIVENRAYAHKATLIVNQIITSPFASERRAEAIEHLRAAIVALNLENQELE